MEIFGIDIGFGFTKATNGNEFVIFKSLMGEATEIQFKMDLSTDTFAKNLHVTIDDQSYFIGDFAEQQSNARKYTLDQELLVKDFVKIFGLTGLGVLTEKTIPLNVVSGLPVGYFEQYRQQFAKILKGSHEITFHKTDQTVVSKKLEIKNVKMIPQPLGTLLNLLMDDDGKVINKELAQQKVGLVDIGFRTTDFTVIDHLRYIERGSSTTDTGTSKCFAVIAKKLRKECGVNVELFRLYKAVETGFIKIRGHEYNISKFRDQVFANAAEVIASDIDRLWADDWDIDTIILTGGGSVELTKHLQPLISGNIMPVENNIDTRLNNVQGYIKFGKHIWGKTDSDGSASS